MLQLQNNQRDSTCKQSAIVWLKNRNQQPGQENKWQTYGSSWRNAGGTIAIYFYICVLLIKQKLFSDSVSHVQLWAEWALFARRPYWP